MHIQIKKNVVLMFPGQGSQYKDMSATFFENNPRYLEYTDTASDLLGKDIQKIIRGVGSMGSLLDETRFSQIAIFCVSTAMTDYLLNDRQVDRSRIKASIGHSLGDYSALYCSGAFNFYDGSRLVIFRGNLMGSLADNYRSDAADPDKTRADHESNKKMMMAAVLGADIDVISNVLKNYKDKVFIANYNDRKQTVISGYRKYVLRASDEIKEAGAKRIIPLKVSIASHCPLMLEASKKLGDYLEENFNQFSGINNLDPYFFSSTRVTYIDKTGIKDTLAGQLISPVRWYESIKKLLDEGADVFIEVGPGKVLSGLVRRIAMAGGFEDIKIFSTDSNSEIENLIAFLKSNNLVVL